MISLSRLHKSTRVDGKTSERGFTLVELAIVLVIIGLVLAAVLKGQELIVSARLKSTISAAGEVSSAAQTFRDKYGALPGDYSKGIARLDSNGNLGWTIDGDGDGVVDGDGVALPAANEETILFWNHLAAANMIAGVSPVGIATIGDGIPSAPVGGGWTIRNELVVGKTTHWLSLGSAVAVPIGVVNSEQALLIDEKADDGRPGTGSIRSPTFACVNDDDVSLDVSAGDSYAPDPATTQCLLTFEL